MSQHDFNIANQSFPATRTDLNNALVALASNSSGDAEPATKYANQWWYETDTNTLKLRNEANDAWISIAVLDQSGNTVQSITTAGLTLGSTAISASGAEINQLDAITRGSILYGNASGATARLAAGGANTFLKSDGTDIAWSTVSTGTPDVAFPSDWASPTNTYTSSGTWSKGSLADTDWVVFYLVGGGSSGRVGTNVDSGFGGYAAIVVGTAEMFNGMSYVVGAGGAGGSTGNSPNMGGDSTIAISSVSGWEDITYTSDDKNIKIAPPKGYVEGAHFTSKPNANFTPASLALPSSPLVTHRFSHPHQNYYHSTQVRILFGGGGGNSVSGGASNAPPMISTYAGIGGSGTAAGTAPGGGGGSVGTGSSGAGAAGSVRVYHV